MPLPLLHFRLTSILSAPISHGTAFPTSIQLHPQTRFRCSLLPRRAPESGPGPNHPSLFIISKIRRKDTSSVAPHNLEQRHLSSQPSTTSSVVHHHHHLHVLQHQHDQDDFVVLLLLPRWRSAAANTQDYVCKNWKVKTLATMATLTHATDDVESTRWSHSSIIIE